MGKSSAAADDDALPQRGALGQRVRELAEAGALRMETGFKTLALRRTKAGLVVTGERNGDEVSLPPVDEIIVATGFRPDLAPLAELRLALDPATESPRALAPLIDPNVHSCGTVPPHGADELTHPERDFYIVGMKSYGRAPTFLLLTGYEQVRSVAAALVGDWEAARDVQLALPETGVCSTSCGIEDAGSSGSVLRHGSPNAASRQQPQRQAAGYPGRRAPGERRVLWRLLRWVIRNPGWSRRPHPQPLSREERGVQRPFPLRLTGERAAAGTFG